MKTNSSTLAPSRFTNFGRLSLATMSVALISFTAAPKALAAGADGSYEFQSASGSLRYDGDNIKIPRALVKRLANVVDGEITIKNNTVKFSKNATVNVVENIADDLDVDVEASVKGPNKVVLKKTGNKLFTGRTAAAVVTSFEGDVFGEDFSGKLKTKVAARVQGKTLTLVINFSGDAFGEDFSGRITVTAKR